MNLFILNFAFSVLVYAAPVAQPKLKIVNYGEKASEAEEALCGAKPISAKAEIEIENKKKRMLENLMPPVSNQSPASWCFAFAATDALNYNNFLNSPITTKPKDFYKAEQMISPIDAVHASIQYRYDRHTPPFSDPIQLNTQVGGFTEYVYLGFNANSWKARSLSQISFDSLDDKNPKTVANVKSLIDAYNAKNGKYYGPGYIVAGATCPAPLYNDPIFTKQINGFKQINEWLYDTAIANNLAPTAYTIDNYEGIAATKGPADIKIAPYLTNKYEGNDKISFLKVLKATINPAEGNGRPVTVTLCAEDIGSKATQSNSQTGTCGKHAVNIVGAYYQKGHCILRLRNSWGADWKDHGHVSVSVDDFLKGQEKYAGNQNSSSKFSADWLSQGNAQSVGVKQNVIGDNGAREKGIIAHTFTGEILGQRFTSTSWGESYKYIGDKLVGCKNIDTGNGRKFTGTVTDLGGGKWQPNSGISTVNGLAVYLHNYVLSSKKIYNGRVEEKNNKYTLLDPVD